ncbi:MAG: VapE family protein, partial [Prevotellaceae bacterium]|nr:VapE family protein [Prevotellaceae bacterium]
KECCMVGLPQEETAVRLHHHFQDVEIEDIRAAVQNVYETNDDDLGRYTAFTKHQMVAYRLREFLDRRYDIRFNEVLQMTEFREKQSLVFVYRELGRRDLNTIHHEALIEGIEPTFGEVDELVHSSRIPIYNPVEDYLRRLPKWDGKDRIKALADIVPTDNPYWQRLFRQWFLSMVAHWMNGDERHANSTAPILIGAQGYRKSTFCRLLLPPELQMFYTDSIDFRSNIEAERTLSRFMLVNIDEFDQLSEKQFAFVKHLFQKPATNIRRMYSETIATQRRYASFIGTTNSDEVLRDPTGNRRYLCVNVTDKINTDMQIDYGQLYAQAMELINHGERYWINDEDEQLIRETNGQFEVRQPLEQLFLAAFHPAEETDEENGEWLTSTEIMAILQTLPAFNKKTDKSLVKLGRILTKLNIAKRRSNRSMLYLIRAREMK